MLADVVATVRKSPLGGVSKLVARFYLFLMGMTVNAERILMTGSTGLTGITGIKTMLFVKIECLVIHEAVSVGVAFTAIRYSRYCFRVNYSYAICICAGIEKKKDHW